jgi:hypothetical protein
LTLRSFFCYDLNEVETTAGFKIQLAPAGPEKGEQELKRRDIVAFPCPVPLIPSRTGFLFYKAAEARRGFNDQLAPAVSRKGRTGR